MFFVLLRQFARCYICDGFYGLNFGQPVCSTCHLFLFPDDINTIDDDCQQPVNEKQDSGDSGNEEPHGEADFYVPQVDRSAEERVLPVSCTAANKAADKLSERVISLSTPRDYLKEKTPEGLFDSLPPEGN